MAKQFNAATALVEKLQSALDYAASEWDMSNAEAVGCLVITAWGLIVEAGEDDDEDEDEDDKDEPK